MLTLHPVTSGPRDGRHQNYPTPPLAPRQAEDEASAQEAACRMLRAYGAVSFLRLIDEAGTEVREFRRGDFFQRKSPLREVHRRVVEEDLTAKLAS